MRNTTLETEKEELQLSIQLLKRQRSFCIFFGICASCIILVSRFPDVAEDFLMNTAVVTNLLTVVVTATVVRWMS